MQPRCVALRLYCGLDQPDHATPRLCHVKGCRASFVWIKLCPGATLQGFARCVSGSICRRFRHGARRPVHGRLSPSLLSRVRPAEPKLLLQHIPHIAPAATFKPMPSL
eukprot:scaffold19286_cov146-Isochrysis_galbana.AAC.2